MADELRNGAIGFILFAVFITLMVQFYNAGEEHYGIVPNPESLRNGSNVAEAIQDLHIVQGFSGITSSIERIKSPSNPADVIGALGAVGLGIVQTFWGVLTLPLGLLSILGAYYPGIPPVILDAVGIIILLTFGFIVLRMWLRSDT